MNIKLRVKCLLAFLLTSMLIAACAHEHRHCCPTLTRCRSWSDAKAQRAIESLAKEYRSKGDSFWKERTYVWAGTWVWPETIGISVKNLDILKKMFYGGDEATKEIVLKVIQMNIPSKKLGKCDKSFLTDLTHLDTELKERRSNIPPPTPHREYIEEFVTPPQPGKNP